MRTRDVVGVVVLLTALAGRAEAASCESLASLTLRHTTITSASVVHAGAFTPPGAARAGGNPAPPNPAFAALPAMCRVTATLTPTADSDIRIEVWLPAAGWNGKYQAVGNGGWTGSIAYPALAAAVSAGYASSSTDTGHAGNTAAFALGHPEKLVDFGYRAVHEMTVAAKAILHAFYGAAPALSVWNGCSQGGRQGIAEAVRFPADFDAVIAGAPAVNFMPLHAGRMALNRAVNATPAHVIPPSKYPVIHRAVLAACDAKDGVADGVLEDPAACTFDPGVLACTGADAVGCLTPAQVESARLMYRPIVHPTTRAQVIPGLARGAELGWGVLGSPTPISFAAEAFKYVIARDPAWDASRFDPARDFDAARAADPGDALTSASPDLRAFFARGGKLLLYHGWSDPQVTPLNTIDYFEKVVSVQGRGAVGSSVQLYMVPGMNHCQGGPGTDRFDEMAAMEHWIRTGTAPARIEASHATAGTVDRTRPLCPYGQVARWNGSGSTDRAENFACVAAGPAGPSGAGRR